MDWMAALEKLFSIIVFFLIPFLGNNHLNLFYVNIDQFWIETSFIILLIAAVFLQYARERDTRTSLLVFMIFFIPFLAMNAAGLAYTWSLFSTLREISVLLLAGCCVTVYAFSAKKEGLLEAIAAGAFASSLCAIIQFAVLFPNLFEIFKGGVFSEIVRGQAIPTSSFSYHNTLGGYLACVLPAALHCGVIRKKVPYIVMSAVIITGIILTTSRIAMVIAAIEMLLYISMTVTEKDLKGFFSGLGILVLAGACLYGLLFAGQKGVQAGVRAELEKKSKITQAQITTLNTRTEIWRNGISAFKERPFAGYGPGAFEYAYRRSFDGGVYTQYSHSVVTKILVELGLIGLLCALWYMAGVLYGISRSAKAQQGIFAHVALGAIILFGAVDFAFDVPAFVITFFVFSFTMLPGSVESSTRTGFKHVLACAILVLLISCLLFTVRANLSKKSIDNGAVYLQGGFIKDAYYAYMDSIHEMPFDNEGRIKAINVLNNVFPNENDAERKGIFKRMLQGNLMMVEQSRDKDSELFLVTGTAYALLSDKKKAEEYLLKAYSYYPSSAYYIYQITNYYVSLGDMQKALLWTRRIDPYLNKYAVSRNPNGLYVYKIRDIEAEIYFKQGNATRALSVAQANLKDAQSEKYTIASARARETVSKESLVKYLQDRADRGRW